MDTENTLLAVIMNQELDKAFEDIDLTVYSDPVIVSIYYFNYIYEIEDNTLYYDGINAIIVIEHEDATMLKLLLGRAFLNVVTVKEFRDEMEKILPLASDRLHMSADPLPYWINHVKELDYHE
jgi:hypothetical protein